MPQTSRPGLPARLALVGVVASGAVEVWLAHRTAAPGGILGRRYRLLAEIGGWWAAYAMALAGIRLLPGRKVVLVVLGLALALRVAALSDKAPLSDDLYRYAWDGVVQQAGISPYRYPPDAAELRELRTRPGAGWLWPADRPDTTLLNRPQVRTIYPPAAEVWFFVEHLVVPLAARDTGYELVGLGLDLAVLAVLLALLRAAGRDERWIALYALAPLPALESVQNAHVDALAVLLVLAAVALAHRHRLPAAGVAVTLAALVKVYPGLLFVLLLRRRGSRLRTLGAATTVASLAYLPHVLTVGPKVLGYLPGYLREEHYGEGARYLLIGLLGLRGTAASVVVVALLIVLLVVLLRSDLPLADAGVRLLAGLFLLVTPVQPWYALLLLALATLVGAWWAVPIAAAGYPLFFAVILDDPGVAVGRWAYGLAGVVAAVGLWRQRSAGLGPPGQPAGALRAG